MGDRFNVNISLSKNYEHLANKFASTGHPDMTRHDWAVNQHRDTHATMLGHYDMLLYAAAAEGVSVGRMRYTLMGKMVQPCGAAPSAPASASLAEAAVASKAASDAVTAARDQGVLG